MWWMIIFVKKKKEKGTVSNVESIRAKGRTDSTTRLAAVIGAVWTTEVVDEYKRKKAELSEDANLVP